MPDDVTNIFISYGRADSRELAIQLRDDLEAVGFSVWLDLSEIPGGSNWSQDIERAIEHCHVTLALMSPASNQSRWCRAEVLRAIRKGKQVIPLLSVPETEPPLHLEHMNYLDFTLKEGYDEKFRDLLSDINAGRAFVRVQGALGTDESPFRMNTRRPRATYRDEKRTAPAFRRFLKELRAEPWLGARFWWPYFAFYFTDLHSVAEMLTSGDLLSPFARGEDLHGRWDRYVRLYFRPRTPDLFHVEGFRPVMNGENPSTVPIPVYLLFDLEAVICHPEALFSDGDPGKTRKTFKTVQYFRDMPFEQIYHDSWFAYDEREEIMRYREAQVLLPERLGLEALQLIWFRSPAEYETLQQLMPGPIWRQWSDKMTACTDYHLFNHKRTYIRAVHLRPDAIQVRFNLCSPPEPCGPFHLQAILDREDREPYIVEEPVFTPQHDVLIDVPDDGPYSVQILLDHQLAYAGVYREPMIVV